ncbi:tandem-95 repeat protein [Aliamphritea hakodatensis]|uniref:tandem-95 repeat protein n=1 Tax=Aliamphritea hakodatensis TaxID=2895352 RepID=UPI0022FD525E|nr:Ig-like domain-containing protein [Aliamphritea hakodatensis]
MADTRVDVVIISVEGDVVLLSEDGKVRAATAEEKLYPGDKIITADNSAVVVDLSSGEARLPAGSTALVVTDPETGETSLNIQTLAGQSEIDGELSAIEQLILAGADPTELLEETAAGAQGGNGVASDGGFNTLGEITRSGESVIATSGFESESTVDPNATDGDTSEFVDINNLQPVTSATDAPTITIVEDSNNDGVINGNELSGLINVTVGLPAGAAVGDLLTVTDGTAPQVIVLTAADIAAGEISTGFSAPVSGSTLDVSATITNPQGFVSPPGTGSVTVDTVAPTVAITLSDDALQANETSTVTFTFSEAPVGFDLSDVTSPNGTLSGLTVDPSNPLVYTATFTPATDVEDASNVITVSTDYTDAAGNTGVGSSSANYEVDTLAPTLSISAADSNLSAGETTVLTFQFSEDVTGFALGDITAVGGTLANFTQVDGDTYTVEFTQSGSDTPSVTVDNDSYTDNAGNNGTGDSLAMTADIVPPAVPTVAGQLTNDATPLITGTAGNNGPLAPGELLTVTVNGATYTNVPVDASGNWSIDTGTAVPSSGTLGSFTDGTYDVVAVVTDAAGNSSTDASSNELVIDLSASASISVNNITPDDIVDTAEASGIIAVSGTVGGDASAGDAIVFTVNGTVYTGTVNADNTTWSVNVSGADLAADTSFAVTLSGSDDAGNPFTATVVSSHATQIAPVNTVPGALTVDEDSLLQVAGVSVDDPDGNLATVQLSVTDGVLNVSLAGGATISSGANGGATLTLSGTQAQINAALSTLTYQGGANFNGTDSLTVTSTDSSGTPLSDTDSISITVTPVDDAFTDDNENISVAEDSGTSTGSVITGTSSVDGPVTVASFTVDTGTGSQSSFNAGDTATITGVGTISLLANGTYSFTPNADYNGPVPVVTYTLTDGSSTDTSTLSITVTPVDDAFTDADEAVSVAEDSGTSTGSVLTGTSSVDGPVTVASFTVDTGTGSQSSFSAGDTATITDVGTITLAANGTYSFTPVADYNGPVPVVTYTLTDGSSTDTSTLSITVTPVDDAFTDDNESISVAEDSGISTGSVLTGTSSVDGPVTVASFTVDTGTGSQTSFTAGQTATISGVGTISLLANGTYSFTPVADYNGPVPVVSYTLTDGSSTDTSTLSITVTPVDDAFTDDNESISVAEDSGTTTGSLLTGTSSVDGPVTVASFTVDTGTGSQSSFNAGDTATITGVGTITLVANGTYSFTPNANYNGPVPVVTYTLTDGSSTDTSTLSITVTPVDDAFTDDNENISVAEDSGTTTGSVLTGTSSVDGPVTVASFTVDTGTGVQTSFSAGDTATITGVGTITLAANGTYSFTPNANYNGPVPVVTYTLTDGSSTDTSTLSITVTPVDDAFTDDNENISVAEDSGTSTGSVITGTSSVDGPVTVASFTVDTGTGVQTSFSAGDTATITGVGTISLLANGTYSFTPAADYNGPVPVVTYTLTDGSSTDTSTLAITVTPVDDAFTDADEAISVAEDSGTTTGSVLTGTSSVDGPVTVASFTVDTGTGSQSSFTAGQTATITGVGTITLAANGTYSFTPNANYNGPVPVVTYTLTDGSSTDTSTLSITVTPVDDAFTDADEAISVAEDSGTSTGSVITGTSSVDGPVTVASFTVDTGTGSQSSFSAGDTATITGVGTISLLANGTYSFTPNADYNGPVPVVTYTLTDGSSTDISTLAITVTPVDDAFTDADEAISVAEDSGTTTGSVLTGTSSVDGPVTVASFTVDTGTGVQTSFSAGDTATITGVGTITLAANGTYSFTPNANYNGPVPVVTYTLTDGSSTDTSTLSITVTPVDDAFTDDNENISVAEDSGISTGSVLTGTSSVDGPVTVASFTVDTGTGVQTSFSAGDTATITGVGTISLLANGTYSFTPNANYNGPVPVVTYTLTDGSSTDTSTLSITVTPVDDAFTDADEAISVAEDSGTSTGSVITGTSSVDGPVTVASFTVDTGTGVQTSFSAGDTATITGVGTISLLANGTYSFTPAADYNGPVPVVTYTLTDGSSTDTSTLSITVTPVDDAFTDDNENISVAEDSGTTTGSVLTGTSSVDGPVTVASFTVDTGTGAQTSFSAGDTATITGVGTITLAANGTYSFTPVADYNGPVPVVSYTLTDGSSTDTSTLSITVTPVDDAFTDADESISVAEDSGTSTGSVLTGTSSVDGPVTVASFTVDTGTGAQTSFSAGDTATITDVGTITLAANGTYSFTPVADYNGPVPVVTYTLTDGSSTDTSTLSITVTPVADAFTDDNENISVAEDSGTTTGSVLSGTSSVDGPVTVASFTVDTGTGSQSNFTAGQTATITGVGTITLAANGTYSFTPAADYNGPVPVVTYTLTDGSSTDTSTLAITVTPVDDAFTDADEAISVAEDSGTTTGSVLTGTSSVDGPVTVASFTVDTGTGVQTSFSAGDTATITGVGTITLAANGTYSFTPNANYNGPVPVVTYTLTDGSSTDTSTLSITVTPVDDAFTDDNENISVAEDSGTTTGSVLTGTSSVDGPVTVASFTVDTGTGVQTSFSAGDTATITGVGTISLLANGTYSFTPNANYNGPVPVVTYTLTDGSSTDTSTLSITVTPVDDAFTDADEAISVAEDSGTSTGSVITGTSSVDGPVTVASFTVDTGTGVQTSFSAGDTATITGVGTISLLANGTYSFTPAADYNGPVPVVTYTLTDGSSTDTSTLAITVTPVDDAFTDADEAISVAEDSGTTTGSVLTGTSSVDGPVTVASFTVDTGTGAQTSFTAGQTATITGVGTITLAANGTYSFTPNANYNGPVPVVTYTLTDGSSTDTSTLSITVTPVDDAFTDADEAISVAEDSGTSTGSVITGTSSVDGPVTVASFTVDTGTGSQSSFSAGDTATITGVGTISLLANGTYSFTPNADYNGPVPVVTYTLTDGSSTDISTLAITVTPVDDAFTDADEAISVAEDSGTTTGSVLTGTSSVDGPVTVASFTVDTGTGVQTSFSAGDTATITGVGTITLAANGTYSFTPNANYNGPVPVVTYTLTDGSSTDTSTLSITVTPVDDAFTDADEAISVAEDSGTSTGSVITGTSSVDGPVTVASFTVDTGTGVQTSFSAGDTATITGVGTITLAANGTYSFTPNADYNGPVPVVTYTLTDGSSTDTSTLSITVTPVDDAFTDDNENISVAEDSGISTGSVLTGTSSVDGPVTVASFTVDTGTGVQTSFSAGDTATITGVGTISLLANGTYSFTPNANYNGPVPVVTYTLTDGSSTDTSTLSITVTPVDDAFTDADEAISVAEDSGTSTGSVITGTSSVDGPVTVASFTVDTGTGVQTSFSAGDTATITGVGTISLLANGTYSFTPAADYNGPVPVVTYTLTDGSSTDTSTLAITVTPVDDAFTDADEAISVAEDSGTTTGSVLTGTSSVDGPVTVASFTVDTGTGAQTSFTAGQTATITGVGTITLAANGTYSFTPNANYNGPVPVVTYTLTDGSSTDTSTLSITVTPVDDAFTDADEAISVAEDSGTSTGSVITGTSSVDGPVTVASFTVDTGTGSQSSFSAGDTATITGVGTISLLANGTYSFTPNADYNGPVPVVTYTLTDGSSTDTSTLSITVTPVDDAFTDADEAISVAEDSGTTTGSVLTGTSSVDGPVTVASFTVDTGTGAQTSFSAGDTATITGVGTITLAANGTYSFTPNADYNGPVPVVTYTLTDGSSTDTSTLSITVTPVDDAFTDDNESISVAEDSGTTTGSVLTGTSSVDGPVTVASFTVDTGTGAQTSFSAGDTATITGVGTITLAANGTYSFTPNANYNGPVPVVTYTLTDGSSTDTSTLSITVTPVDDAFTDADEAISVAEDSGTSTGSVLTGTSSVDGPVTVASFTVDTGTGSQSNFTAGQTATISGVGTISLLANGTYSFTPNANYNGPVPVVTYTLTDGSSTDTSTLSITVTPVDDAFTDANEVISVAEDSGTSTGSVLTGTSSVDGPVTVASFTVDTGTGVQTSFSAGDTATITGVGTITLAANGTYSFTPNANYNGPVPVVTYTLTDGSSTDTSTLSITVTPVDDAFTDDNENISVAEDSGTTTGSVLTGTSSVDGPVTVASFTVDTGTGVQTSFSAGDTATITGVGTISLLANGTYSFTPNANYNGPVPVVTYTLTDGSSTDTSTLSITVTPVDDAFTDADEAISVAEDSGTSTGSVITGTSSVDGPVTVASFTVDTGTGVQTSFSAGDTATITGVGTISLLANGTYSFTPAADYNGPVPVVTYTLTDGSSTDTSTLAITVTPVDDAFTDADEAISVAEDSGTTTGSVLTGTSSVDGPVTVASFTVDTGTGAQTSFTAGQTATITGVGTITLAANGTYSFTPNANYNGPVPVVTYTLTDGSSTDTSTLSITVTPVDDAFTDADEAISVAEDSGTSTGSVITGTSSVDGPVTVASFTVDTGTGAQTSFSAGDTATITGVGTITLAANGTYSFTPVADYNGPVPVVSYTLTDGSSTDTSTLSITVTPVDDAFTDADEAISVAEDSGTSTGSVITGTSSVDGPVTVASFTVDTGTGSQSSFSAGDTATITGVGTISLLANGTYSFTPNADYNGPVPVVTYTLTDGSSTDTSTLSITVTPVDDAFTDADEAISVAEDSGTTTGSVLTGTSSVDGPVTVASFTVDTGTGVQTSFSAGDTATITGVGTITLAANGTYSFTPNANYNGPVPVVTYTLTDGSSTDTSTLSITVTPVDDAFTDDNENISVAEDSGTTTGSVLTGTSSVDGPVTVASFTVDTGTGVQTSFSAGDTATITGVGTISLLANGTYSFTPNANYNGPVPVVTYTLTDGSSTDTSTLSITVTPVDDAFTDADEAISVAEDSGTSTGSVITGTSSVDGPVTVASFTVDTGTGVQTSFSAGDTATITGVGTISLLANGTYSFTPAADYNGPVPVVTYTLTDGSSTDTSTLAITVTPVDDAFTDADEAISVAEDSGTTTGSVLTGTSSVDGPVTVASFTVDTGTGAQTSFTAGQTATITGVGTITLAANGTYSFTPNANYNGPVPVVTYTLTDGSSTDTSTLSITVTPVDDAFTDADEAISVAEDSGTSTGSVITGTSSVDGPVTVASFTVDTGTGSQSSFSAGDTATITGVGTISLLANGTYSFTPNADYNGPVPVVTYTLTDGSSTDISTLAITVTPVDDAFTDADEAISVAEDSGTTTGSVLTGTSSVDGPVTVASFTVDTGTGVQTSFSAGDTATITGVGTITLAANGTYSFTPNANYNGPVPVVTYTLTDGSSTDTSTLSITVTPVDDAFTDADEAISVAEDSGTSTGSVITGTSSVDGPVTVASFTVDTGTGVQTSFSAGDTATITGVGTITLAANGTYSFTPNADYNGPVPVVTYTLTDGSSTDTSTLSITVTPVDDAFTDDNENISVAEDSGISTGSVLTGTSSVDGPVTVASFTVDTGTGVQTSFSAGDTATITGVGTISLLANGTYSFTPNANYNGPVPVVTYTLTDGSSTDTSTLSITVTPVDDAFTDADEAISVAEDSGTSTGSVITGTSSVDGPVTVASFTVDTGTGVQTSFSAGDTATITGVGTISLLANGTYSFTPAADYNGPVPVVTYTLTDGSSTDTSTLAITVTPVDDAFTDADEAISVAEDSGTTTGSVLTGTSSVDGPVTVASFTVDTGTGAQTSFTAGQTATITGVGTITLAANGTYSFTPNANYNGPVPVVTYTLTDGSSTDTSTLSITVTPVDDAFTDADEAISVAEDSGTSTGSVITGTSSVDGPVTVASFTVDTGTGSQSSFSAGDTATITGVGTISLLANGTYSFTPNADYNGPVPVVTYTLTDGSSTDTSTLSITVTPVDDAFTDADEAISVAEDSGTTTGSVLTGTSSVDGPVTVASFTVDTGTGAQTSFSAGDTATITGVGTITLAANGTYSFTPNADYNGPVPVVTYTLTDGSSTDTSTLSITVTPVDDAFTDDNESISVAEDSGTTTGSVLTGTSSVDGPVTVASFTVDTGTGAQTSFSAGDTATITGVGTITLAANGTYSFTPNANYNGPVPVVTYTLTDGSSTDTSTLSITVTPVDDAFTDADEAISVAEDSGTSTGSVLTGTSSVDGPVTVASFTVDTGTGSQSNFTAGQTATISGVGTISLLANGTYSFTPNANYNGPVPVVTYTLTDGSSTDTSTLSITVTPVDDAFTDANEVISVAEDSGTSTGSVLTGTSSVDGPVTVASFTVDTGTGSQNSFTAGQTATITGVGTISLWANGTYSFTPVADYNGPAPVVTYTLTDGSSTDTSTLSITVTPVDDAFTDDNENISVAEDSGTSTGSVITGTSSVDGPVTVASFTVDTGTGAQTSFSAGDTATITGVGTITLAANGTYSFTPVADYNGPVPVVSYTLTDGSSTDTSTLSITVTPVDDAFTDADEAISVAEDSGTSTGSVITGTSSVDGPVTVASFTVDTGTGSQSSFSAGDTATITGVGTISLLANGTYSFTPNADYNGPVPVVTYTLTDGSSTDTSTLSITVTPVDDAFTDADEAISVAEDSGTTTGSVLTGTSSVDGPVTVASFTVDTGTGVQTSFSAGDTATITGVGTITLAANGTYSFTPNANYNGPVPVVTYTLTDGSSTDTSTLSITVTPVDDAFTDADEAISVAEDSGTSTGSVLTGTSSVDGPVTVASFTVDTGTGSQSSFSAGDTATITGVGTITLVANGTYSFTPNADYNGPVPVVTYTLTDGSSTDTSTLSITVTPVDDAFTDADEAISVAEDSGTSTGSVLTGTSSVDGPVTVASFTVDTGTGVQSSFSAGDTATITDVGTISLLANGTYSFTPNADYNGPVPVVTYTLTDGSSTDTSTLSITVTPVDDAFTDDNESISVAEDSGISTGSVLTGTSSVDGPVTVASFTVDTGTGVQSSFSAGDTATITGVGTISLLANGTYSFTPAADYNGPVPVVTYTLTDGSSTDTSTLTITVAPVDDAFTDDNENISVAEDSGTSTGSVLTGTSSVDGPVTVASFTVDTGTGVQSSFSAGDTATITGVGTISLLANGTYSFTPAADYNGPVPVVTYTLTDGSSTDTSTLTITVAPVDDAFTDDNENISVAEDSGTTTGSVLTGTSSVDGPVTVASFTVDTGTGAQTSFSAGDTATITGVGTITLAANGTYSFTPVADYNGPVPVVSYTLTDGSSTDTSTLAITVTPVDDAFTDADENISVAEDSGTTTGSVLTGTSSVDGPVTVASFTVDTGTGAQTSFSAGDTVTITGVGTITLAANGTYSFTPNANYNGPVPVVTYTLTDGSSTDTSTLTVNVTSVTDLTAGNDSASTAEDVALNGSVAGNDSTTSGGTLTYTMATDVSDGTLVFNTDGTYTYTPAENFSGNDSFTYTVTDSLTGESLTRTVALQVTPVADTPDLWVVPNVQGVYQPLTQINTSANVSQSNIESQLGLNNNVLDTFNPPSGAVTDNGNVDATRGDVVTYEANLEAGDTLALDWTFNNGETSQNFISSGYNDLAFAVITDPNGNTTIVQLSSSEQVWSSSGAGSASGTQSVTATVPGTYQVSFIVMNGRDQSVHSNLNVTGYQLTQSDGTVLNEASVPLAISAGLRDSSETLTIQISGVPAGATLSAGINNGGGVWTLTQAELEGLMLTPASGFTGDINLTVTATSTESNGSTSTATENITVNIAQTTNEQAGNQGNNTLNGTGNNDNIDGSGGNDTLNGNNGNDLLSGGTGNDTLNGGSGNDILDGGISNDTLNGNSGHDQLRGGDGTDTLTGGSGNDIIWGDAGDDIIFGGLGTDQLSGGDGADRFTYLSSDVGGTVEIDTILDFDQSEGDVLDLTSLLNTAETANNLDAYLNFEKVGNDTLVHVNSDGDYVSGSSMSQESSKDDMVIRLQNVDLTNNGGNTDLDILQQMLASGSLETI